MRFPYKLAAWLLPAALLAACGGAAQPAASTAPSAAASQPSSQAKPAASPASSAGPRASSAAASSSASASLQALIDGARKEGKLTLEYDENSGGGSAAIKQWTPTFNALYGLNIDVQYTPGGDYPQQASKITQQTQAGRPTSTDIYISSPKNVTPVVDAGVVGPADWSWAPNIQDPRLLEANGAAVRWYAQLPGIMYNTDKLKGDAVPKTMQDLLKPQYKGLIASTPYAAQFDVLAAPVVWGPEKTISFTTAFSQQLAGLIRCGEGQRVGTGEFTLFALDCGTYESEWLHRQGVPVADVIPSDVPMISWSYVSVPKNAPHPNAAKLWVNYLLSPAAQKILVDTKGPDNPYVPGSTTAEQMKTLEAKGVKFIDYSVDFTHKYADPKTYQEVLRLLTKK